jgi:hypothetical protein
MLIDIDTGRTLQDVPFKDDFNTLRSRLTVEEFDAAVECINRLIDDAGAEIATAGWLPGNDWTGTPFEPIFSKAAAKNQALGGKLFGLLVWYTIMQRPERWGSGRYKKDGVEIRSRTYFRLGDR